MSLEVIDIHKKFGEKQVLDGVNFKVRQGEAFGILGRNGTGKTTTIRIILGIILEDSGKVVVNGGNKAKVRFGYLPEERGLYPKITVAEQMRYIGELRGVKPSMIKSRSLELLKSLDADEYYKKKVDTLSKGNQQKIQLAISLINDPDIVILDEPFSGLDPVNSQILKACIKDLVSKGKTVLFSSHQMAQVEEFCENICIMNKGKIVLDGSIPKIKRGYPRNRIRIVPDIADGGRLVSEIKKRCFAWIDNIVETQSDIKVILGNEGRKDELYKFILEQGLKFDSISIIEPTLEEIFVEKTGDENAAISDSV